MTAINLSFDTTGVGSCLYTEAIALQNIGNLEITRATNIEFNHTKQAWEVRDLENQVLYSNASRQQCLSWEQQNYNQ
jgi:hypothetical protein